MKDEMYRAAGVLKDCNRGGRGKKGSGGKSFQLLSERGWARAQRNLAYQDKYLTQEKK